MLSEVLQLLTVYQGALTSLYTITQWQAVNLGARLFIFKGDRLLFVHFCGLTFFTEDAWKIVSWHIFHEAQTSFYSAAVTTFL